MSRTTHSSRKFHNSGNIGAHERATKSWISDCKWVQLAGTSKAEMRALERRLRKIEQADRGSRIVVVDLREYAGETQEEALERAGVTLGPDDLVVFVEAVFCDG